MPQGAAAFYVEDLPGLEAEAASGRGDHMYAGFLPTRDESALGAGAEGEEGNLFFVLTKSHYVGQRQRLVLWFNGGPGCSSLSGFMLENGPVRMDRAGKLHMSSLGWSDYANILFIDQPVNTGLSYGEGGPRELSEAAEQVVSFLINFFAVFPDLELADVYIAGESYAGQYVPYIADAIQRTTLVNVRLRGLILGNPWLSPKDQYPAYETYMVDIQKAVSPSQADKRLAASRTACLRDIHSGANSTMRGLVLIDSCEHYMGQIQDLAKTSKDACVNAYNISQYIPCGGEERWPDGMNGVDAYLKRADVRAALHAQDAPHPWEMCTDTVADRLQNHNSVPSSYLLPRLLESAIPVLIYVGDQDFVCSFNGIEDTIANLTWSGATGFTNASAQEYVVQGRLVGSWRHARNLTLVRFTDGSHMVPIDEPEATLDMVLRFMNVDILAAAGPAGQIPSQLGASNSTLIGITNSDGSKIAPSVEPGLTSDGFDPAHEEFYGPRRTAALFVFVTLVGVALWSFLLCRRRRPVDRLPR